VLGDGERLFGETSDKKSMRLICTRTLGDDLVILTYQLIREASPQPQEPEHGHQSEVAGMGGLPGGGEQGFELQVGEPEGR
jgi:hypothetical protein